MAISTIPFDRVRARYHASNPDGHWFDKETLRFFGSKLPATAFDTPAGILFISSELDFDRARRYYNVRQLTDDGDIKTIGRFNDYRTRAEAKAAIVKLSEEASHVVD
jgi:hypothetical protein